MKNIFRLRYDISFLIMSLAVGVLVISGARDIPAPTFEPMGAASFPIAIAAVTVFLVMLKFFKSLFEFKANGHEEDDGCSGESNDFLKSLIMFIMFTIFVGVVYFSKLPLWACSFFFLVFFMVLLKRPESMKGFSVSCGCAAAFSFFVDYVAVNVLYFNI